MASHTAISYAPAIAQLIQPRLLELGPGQPVSDKRQALTQLSAQDLVGPRQKLADKNAAECCLAGLWLLYDFLEECHRICQPIATVEGSYWHAIMHRREPDAANSKYWWRRVGQHPIFPELANQAAQLALATVQLPAQAAWLRRGESWDPFAFVDLCEAVRDTNSQLELLCRQIQLAEWQLLFDYCYTQAVTFGR